jgi:thiol-disulfide isomerase/thioredoxin
MSNNRIEEITSMKDLYRELGNDKDHLIVLKLYFSFCGACLKVMPVFTKATEKYSDRIRFMQADVDDVDGLAEHFDLTNVPTFVSIYKQEVRSRPSKFPCITHLINID